MSKHAFRTSIWSKTDPPPRDRSAETDEDFFFFDELLLAFADNGDVSLVFDLRLLDTDLLEGGGGACSIPVEGCWLAETAVGLASTTGDGKECLILQIWKTNKSIK